MSEETRTIAQGVCDLAFRCCTTGEAALVLGPFTNPENCEDRLQNRARLAQFAIIQLFLEELPFVAIPNVGVLQEAVDDERVKISEDQLKTCLDYMEETDCNLFEEDEEEESCEPPELLPEEGPCDLELIFRGQVEKDGDCSSPGLSLECKEDLVCITVDSLGVNGVCAEPGEVGDYCYSDAECHEDLYCASVDGTCQEFAKEGEVCAFGNPDDPSPDPNTALIRCDAELGLSCDPVTDRCVAPCQLGASCSGDESCDEEQGLSCILGRCDRPRPEGLPCSSVLDCQEGLRCDQNPANPAENICQALLPEGARCNVFNPEECDSGFCNPQGTPADNTDDVCDVAAAPGGPCLTTLHTECAGGYCENPNFFGCVIDGDDCPAATECVDHPTIAQTYCVPYCIAAQPNGSDCTFDEQCESEACVASICRELPLSDGRECTSSDQCASEYCSLDGTCETPPLPNGSTCNSPDLCESGVCHEFECKTGLQEGDDCSSLADPPCAPGLYCEDNDIDLKCAPLLGPGESCDGSFQCHGSCGPPLYGRNVCDATVGDEEAFCDGEE